MTIADFVSNVVNRAAIDAVNESLIEMKAAIEREIPVKSGAARNSIRIVPAKFRNGIVVGGISIGDSRVNYIQALINGYDADYTNGYYHFPADAWPDGPPELLGKDGWYHFAWVHHHQPANDFVSRALKNADVQYKLAQRVLKRIKFDFKVEVKG